MTEGTPQQLKITKRFGRSIKTADGGILSFATELEAVVVVSNGEQFIAEGEKLFNQAVWLTNEDIRRTFEAQG